MNNNDTKDSLKSFKNSRKQDFLNKKKKIKTNRLSGNKSSNFEGEKNKVLGDILKRIFYALVIMIIVTSLMTSVTFAKYKPVYAVKVNDEIIGYVQDIQEIKNKIENEIINKQEECAVFTTLDVEPEYEFCLMESTEINEDSVIKKLDESSTTLYKVYAILLNGEEKVFVKTWEEAEEVVNSLKETYSELNPEITVVEKYTENIKEMDVNNLMDAMTYVDNELRSLEEARKRREASTVNGVYLEYTPVVNYHLSSRYGIYESGIRDHAHSGIDLAASEGTDIRASAAGTVTISRYYGGYGNLVVIDHGNGVETYYGHCSKLYVSEGEYVEAGTVIAAVGSTGNSTGAHCHFEVRINGSTVNPQNYICN